MLPSDRGYKAGPVSRLGEDVGRVVPSPGAFFPL